MADDEPPPAEQHPTEQHPAEQHPAEQLPAELVVFTGTKSIRRNVVVGGICLAIVVADVWLSALLLGGRTGARLDVGMAVALVIGAPALWLVFGHYGRIRDWWRWRNRPVPAMRLTESGLDYSPAYTGSFPLHVDWGVPLESAFRQGSDNKGFFWCLYSPIIDGLDPLPAFIHRQWPLPEQRVRAELRELIRVAAVDRNSPEQMAAAEHLVIYGTPIIINPAYWSGPPIAVVDAFLREHTGDRCTLTPPRKPVPPTITYDV